ncbi:hypothetical protein M0R45_024856 [Rubus argutus]|uniref:Uncharacterized protein n=1 Tax=Rubus argutus TaxID=59490 RepID=A0AAW1WS90_RUBAR
MDSNATTAATVILGEKRKSDNQDYVLEEDHEEDSIFATTHDCDHPDHPFDDDDDDDDDGDDDDDSNFDKTHQHPDLLDRGIFAYVDEDDYEVHYDDYGEPVFFYFASDANIRSSSPIRIPDSLRDCPPSPPPSPPLGTLEPATPELLKALDEDENWIASTPDPTPTTKEWSFSAFRERCEERRRKRLCLSLDRV